MLYLKAFKRKMTCCIAVLMLLCLVMPPISTADAAMPYAQKREQLVRVSLTRLGITDRLDVTLLSPYLLISDTGTRMYLREGSEAAFLLRDQEIYFHDNGTVISLGTKVQLLRTEENEVGQTGFYRTHFPALYMGDLYLDVFENKLRPILHIHVEDYLLGVVPYEMSDSFPVEALKAQAVAARTYVLRKQDASRDFDVVDTTNDQVFKGYLPGNTNAEKAVAETQGVCGFYKGNLAQCYYSASNGGQMELVQSVWPTQEDFGYYTFGADPYDVENPESVVRSFELLKNGSSPLLMQWVCSQLGTEEELVRIDQITAVRVGAPVHEGSQLMTSLEIDLSLSTRTLREAVVDQDAEEVSLFLVEQAETARPTSTPSATAQPTYGPFVELAEPFTLTIPIFPMAEDAFGMDISSNYDNEIWTVVEKNDRFVLEARRYGHGVGMSQRGAQWMAAKYGKTYRDILSFYYPGLQLMRYPAQEVTYAQPEEALTEQAGPAPSPTPKPTLMPTTLEAADGQWFGIVTEISADSSLNLRAEPDLSSEILMRLYKNQRLLVVEESSIEGWVKVKTDVAEGYVMEKYLTKE